MVSLKFTASILLVWVASVVLADLELVPILDPTQPKAAHSSSKRAESFTGELDLQDFETFFWGAPAGDKLIYANLTVYFPEQYESVIAMERFAGHLKSVDCGENMMLEFKNDKSFEYAKNVWNWVNTNVNNSFIMVTNYEGCADHLERLPFVVSNIKYDEVANKAFLTADQKEWEDIAHSYTLHVGNMPLTPVHRMLMSRGVLPRAADFAMSLASAYDKNLFSTTVGGWTTSVDATIRTAGSLNVDFDVDVSWLKLKSAAMTINPENVAASMQLALTEKGTLTKAYNWQKTILSIPIQGITIAKVVKLGAFLDIDVGFTMDEWAGEAHASLGARMEISNSAIVKVDLVNSKNNAFSGWTPSFTPIPLTLSAKVEGSAKAYAEPNVKLEASALGKGWNVGLNMQMPYIAADFAAMYDSTGVCDTKKTLGVDIDARVGVELTVQAATKGNEANPFWEQELYSTDWPLFSKCMAFGPNNAKTGEVVEPNPATKTKKSKTKSSTKKSSKKPTPTPTPTKKSSSSKKSSKTPTSTPPPSSKKSSTTPKSTPPPSSKKSKSEDPEPTNKSSSKKASSKSGDDATSITDTSKTSSSSGTGGPIGSKSSNSDDESGSISQTSSSSTFSTTSWSNSTRTSHPDDGSEPTDNPSASSSRSSGSDSTSPSVSGSDPSGSGSITPSVSGSGPSGSSSQKPSATGNDDDNDDDNDDGEQPSTSSSSSRSAHESDPHSTITPPPSTFTTITSTVTASSSKSSEDDSCDITGCQTCEDSLDSGDPSSDYLNMELEATDNLTARALEKREGTKVFTYICLHVTEYAKMAKYPRYTDYTNPSFSCSVDRFYEGENVKDCLNHQISFATTPPSPVGTPVFAMEHIYEGNWIMSFFRELVRKEGIECDQIRDIFFSENRGAPEGAADKWIREIMASLGSTDNQDLLVFLRQNINEAKNRIFMEGNDIIADDTFKKAMKNGQMFNRMATVGRAMDYMEQHDVAERLKNTAIKVEEALEKLVEAAEKNEDLAKALGKYTEKGLLKQKHRVWLSAFLERRNTHAQTQMVKWASSASSMIFTGSVTPIAGKPLETWKSLEKWKSHPQAGFQASVYL